MANPEHLEILKQGVDVWNRWREKNSNIVPDLRSIILEGERLCHIDFVGANLAHAYLKNADLSSANLSAANLLGASFQGADLTSAELSGANLSEADLEEASLYLAYLYESILFQTDCTNTDFTECNFGLTVFADCNLSQTIGIETAIHHDSSTLGIDTLYLSSGKIPEVFLRGCGVPDTLITYAKSLIDNPIDYYSCFISYTEKDDVFSERLYNDMQAKGIRCWRWKEDAKWGEVLREEIDTAVRYYDKLVVICSESSLKSPAVLEEIKRALNKEDTQGNGVLFPIMIDDYLLNEWDHYLKVRITDKVVGDFRDWNGDPEKYRKSVERLVKDLNRRSAVR